MKDVYFKTNELNVKAQGLEKSMQKAVTETEEAKTNLQNYYDVEKQVIELELGTTIEKANASYKQMNDELYRLNTEGKGGTARAKELKEQMVELKPKIDEANSKIIELNNSVAGVPELKTIDMQANTEQAKSDVENYKSIINSTPKSWTTTFTAKFNAFFSPEFVRATKLVESGIGNTGRGGNSTLFGTLVQQRAKGGIDYKPILTTFAENGPEAAIPLDGSDRSKRLWVTAGRMLGMDTEEKIIEPTRIKSSLKNETNDWNINVTYNVYSNNNNDITSQFEKNNRRLMEMIEEKTDRKRRLSYA